MDDLKKILNFFETLKDLIGSDNIHVFTAYDNKDRYVLSNQSLIADTNYKPHTNSDKDSKQANSTILPEENNGQLGIAGNQDKKFLLIKSLIGKYILDVSIDITAANNSESLFFNQENYILRQENKMICRSIRGFDEKKELAFIHAMGKLEQLLEMQLRPEANKLLESLTTDIKRMNNIDEAFKFFIDIQNDDHSITSRFEENNIRLAFDNKIALLKNVLDNKDTDIVINCDAKLPEKITTDYLHLLKIVDFLLENAIKYTPKKTCIVISVTTQDDYLKVTIHDQGKGFDQPVLHKLFKLFDQKEKSKHFDIRLSLLERVVRSNFNSHMGAANDQGAVVWFTFPYAVKNSQQLTVKPLNKKVLLLDNNQRRAQIYQQQLGIDINQEISNDYDLILIDQYAMTKDFLGEVDRNKLVVLAFSDYRNKYDLKVLYRPVTFKYLHDYLATNVNDQKVLLIDDDKLMINIFKEALKKTSCDLTKTMSVKKGLTYLKNDYDLIFIDINLKNGKKGDDLVKKFGAKHPETPIMAITTETNRVNIDKYLEAGFTNVVFKPINFDIIRELVTHATPVLPKQ